MSLTITSSSRSRTLDPPRDPFARGDASTFQEGLSLRFAESLPALPPSQEPKEIHHVEDLRLRSGPDAGSVANESDDGHLFRRALGRALLQPRPAGGHLSAGTLAAPGGTQPEKELTMRILVAGAGATGGYFGGRLAQAGRDVTFLVRPGRAKQLSETGLCIISPHGDAVITPKLVNAEKIDTSYDLEFLSVKAYALDSAMNDFAAAVGPETMIFPALNGIGHLDVLTKRFGERPVIGGVCFVAADI